MKILRMKGRRTRDGMMHRLIDSITKKVTLVIEAANLRGDQSHASARNVDIRIQALEHGAKVVDVWRRIPHAILRSAQTKESPGGGSGSIDAAKTLRHYSTPGTAKYLTRFFGLWCP